MLIKFNPTGTRRDDTDLAYTAGLIDGEGSIGVYKYKRKDCKLGFHYELTITVNMVDDIATKWLHSTFGGCLKAYKSNGGLGKKLTRRWVISAKQGEILLKEIMPYLKTKQKQAEVALEFRTTVLNMGKNGMLQEQLNKQEELSQKLKGLKRDEGNI